MAVDISVLERRSAQSDKERMSNLVPNRSEYEAEEEHNARIRENYARLINPNNSVDDVFVQETKSVQSVKASATVKERPYLVQNARVDSDIFRAESPVNSRMAEAKQMSIADYASDEEENEDLRPTATTIQYRTIASNVKETEEVKNETGRFSLTKGQKIAMVCVLATIVSLIVLIIINSTVIANLNADIANLNAELNAISEEILGVKSDMFNFVKNDMITLRGAYAGVSESVHDVASCIFKY
ncbi:MAG: hypothetical protein ACI4MS_07540 [Candidatus Coproplasma sp.]